MGMAADGSAQFKPQRHASAQRSAWPPNVPADAGVMAQASRIPLKLAIGLALAVALDTATQITWKKAVSEIPDGVPPLATAQALLHEPLFAAAVVLMICKLVNWLRVLDRADLSFAKPVTSLSYVTVCILSGLYLGEDIGALQIIGIGVVIAGVWCISRTAPSSPRREAAAP